MVEVKERLHVDINEFFKQLEISIAYDIEKATGKKVKPYKGYKYKKVMKNKVGRKGDVEVIITELNAPKCYSASFKSINGINKISYIIEEVGEYCIDVTYREEFEGSSKTINTNFKLMQFFYKRRAKKRASRILRAIENYIKQNI